MPLFSNLGISVGKPSPYFKICHFLMIQLHTANEKETEMSGSVTPGSLVALTMLLSG